MTDKIYTGLDLEKIYELRKKFIVIGITGTTGSGCTKVADILMKKFDENLFPTGDLLEYKHNNDRKYNIVYNIAKENWEPFVKIKYSDVITFILLSKKYKELIEYLTSLLELEEENWFWSGNYALYKTYMNNIISNISDIKKEFDSFSKQLAGIDITSNIEPDKLEIIGNIFFNEKFKIFCEDIQNIFQKDSKLIRVKILHTIANNIRKSGDPYNETQSDLIFVYQIAKVINQLIKSFRKNILEQKYTRIVIDSLRNPSEILFFKERYSAFYMFAVNINESKRKNVIDEKYDKEKGKIYELDYLEYKPKKGEFYKQDVSNCIQKADIYLNNINENELNNDEEVNTLSPQISLKQQIIKYIALIIQPGAITPNPEERCMQIAYTAKYNSGCISRQVGAVVTDDCFSVKGIGWNNSAEGQVPCLLRNVEDLIDDPPKHDSSYSEYEKNDEFKANLNKEYSYETPDLFMENSKIKNNKSITNGRNISFCFKDIKNSYSEGKNQVHTRSLHAEENAFLQIAKYGGMKISEGFLFTTASPCELCSKKAFQLKINRIFYIDPYPGISKTHVLSTSTKNKAPMLTLFMGQSVGLIISFMSHLWHTKTN